MPADLETGATNTDDPYQLPVNAEYNGRVNSKYTAKKLVDCQK